MKAPYMFQLRSSPSWLRYVPILLLLVWNLPATALADDQRVNQVKSAFVYNIAKFVTWPESVYVKRPDTFNLCFLQRNSFQGGTQTIEGKTIQQRSIRTQVLQDQSELSHCDLLLLQGGQLDQIDWNLNRSGVLVMADLTDHPSMQDKAHPGVIVNLYRRGKSIGFEVSLKQAERAHLRLSSQLLKLAKILEDGDQ